MNWSLNFGAIASQIVGTGGATGGGGTPPPPPPAASAPRMNTDTPRANSTVTTDGFTIAGWALDSGAPVGTGVDLIQVWAYPAGGGAPRFVGTANYGTSRPDVAAAFGNARFMNSGFLLTGVIDSGGAYDLTVFAHSTVTGTYNNVQQFRINVTGPVSLPRMWTDIPAMNQTLSQNITVAGWAVDAGGSIGTGVDAVHVYGYPVAGGAPILVGVAVYGVARGDVAGAFGNPRFTPSGFYLQGTLPPGEYNLVVFAHSTITNTFNNVQVIRVRVV